MESVTEVEDLKQNLADSAFTTCYNNSAKTTRSNLPQSFMVAFIKGYRYWLSPLLPASCRFYPSCSAYALESYQRFGFWKGSYLSLWRILKCNPFHPGGVDPVQETPISLETDGM